MKKLNRNQSFWTTLRFSFKTHWILVSLNVEALYTKHDMLPLIVWIVLRNDGETIFLQLSQKCLLSFRYNCPNRHLFLTFSISSLVSFRATFKKNYLLNASFGKFENYNFCTVSSLIDPDLTIALNSICHIPKEWIR